MTVFKCSALVIRSYCLKSTFEKRFRVLKFSLSMCLVLLTLKGYSQIDLPKVIPPAPETAALFRYQDYPMDYSTGVPQINIPIYEATNGSLSVPISISYHASGLRVTDQDGPIAVGWSLQAGGMISRTIYGSPDFSVIKFPYPFESDDINNLHPVDDLALLQDISHSPSSLRPGQYKDGEYDIFSYAFGEKSGKIIFKDENNVKTPLLIPHKPYAVTPSTDNSWWGITGFKIIDDKGVTYRFAANEYQSTFGAPTGFSLIEIVSADKTDTISFTYTYFTQQRISISQQWILDDTRDVSQALGLPGASEIPQQNENKNTDFYQIARLTEIDFKQGKVKFNLVPDTDKIDNIQIINQDNETIKTIQFNRSLLTLTSDGNKPMNKLNEIVFKDKTGVGVDKYEFEYYPVVFPPGLNEIDLRHADYWGYYNASGVHEMVPYYTVSYDAPCCTYDIGIGDISSNRNPNLEALKSGVLKKITYPTGGTTEFNYENNKYQSLAYNQVKLGPGLRVLQIVSNDNRGTISKRTFKYGEDEIGYSFIDLEPNIQSMSSEQLHAFLSCYTCSKWEPGGCGWYRKRIYYSSFIPELSVLAERPIVYREVAEYHGAVDNNIGKSVYEYEYSPWYGSGYFGVLYWNYWNTPVIKYQTDFKFLQGTSSFQKVREITNNYTNQLLEEVSGIHIKRFWSLPGGISPDCEPSGVDAEAYAQELQFDLPGMTRDISQVYDYSEYKISVGVKNLTSTEEKIFNDDNTFITSSTSYTYNDKQLPSKTQRTVSDGSNLITEIKYPFDFTGSAVLSQMMEPTTNMVNYPVEQIETRNGNHLRSVKTNFFDWGSTNAMIAPQTAELKEGSGAYETRLRYHEYDNEGNPISVSKEKDIVYSYLWDYQRSLPTAEMINASSADVASTSFEADGTGNWTGILTSNVRNDVKGITGKQYYNLNGGTLTKDGLSSSAIYIISYWSRSGFCNVNGTPVSGWPKSLKTVVIDGVNWTYCEHRVSGVSSINISGSVMIDELRLYPVQSQMTSYTYEPLVGITSKCDANNVVSYYEYDNYGRLKLIKDFDGNILRTISYAYQSTTP